MPDCVKYDAVDASNVARFGLSHKALSAVLLGSSDAQAPYALMSCPKWARDYIMREFRAGDLTFRALQDDAMVVPDPRNGVATPCAHTFVLNAPVSNALFKVFAAGDMPPFCLVFGSLTGRVTHVIVPDRNCVIYDLSPGDAVGFWHAFKEDTARLSGTTIYTKSKRRPRIGILDMVTNFAHQAMNHLSGLQRLLDRSLGDSVDEIWTSGTEFFGPTEAIFPEFARQIRHVRREEVAGRLAEGEFNAFKIGSNVVTLGLRDRLLHAADSNYPGLLLKRHSRSPLLAVTVRAGGRNCVNLASVVERLVSALLPRYPQLGVILDGWVFPETAIEARSTLLTAISPRYLATMRREALVAQEVAHRLPAGVLVDNLIGTSMLQSLVLLRSADAYLAHIGTLQHKIAWFTNARGVAHGPSAELSQYDCGRYASEVGSSPTLVTPSSVLDIPIHTERGSGFFDYEITDIGPIVESLEEVLSAGSNRQ